MMWPRAQAVMLLSAFGLTIGIVGALRLVHRDAVIPGSIALTGVSIVESTGQVRTNMTVVIANGRIHRVEQDGRPLAGSDRTFDARGKLVVAVTLDPAEPAILDGFRHAWVGQFKPGDPGDVFVLNTFDPRRFRSEDVTDASVVAAVVGGKYYTHNMLLAQREQPGGR
jgi:hypothetical protein